MPNVIIVFIFAKWSINGILTLDLPVFASRRMDFLVRVLQYHLHEAMVWPWNVAVASKTTIFHFGFKKTTIFHFEVNLEFIDILQWVLTWSPVPAKCMQIGLYLSSFHFRGNTNWKYDLLDSGGTTPGKNNSIGVRNSPSISTQSDVFSSFRIIQGVNSISSTKSTNSSTYSRYLYWIVSWNEIVACVTIWNKFPKFE